jgi:hypothetical protein
MKSSIKLWTSLLTAALITVPLAICGGLLYFYLRDEVDNRRLISFMNFEQIAYRFDRSLEGISDFNNNDGVLTFANSPLALVVKEQTQAGQVPEGIDLKVLPDHGCDIQNVSNVNYVLCPMLLPKSSVLSSTIEAGYYWGIWRLPPDSLAIFANLKPSRIFIVNSRGKLIYQSDSKQPQEELLHKPFVQEFIRMPLSKEASAPYTEMESQVLGFAMNLNYSNSTLFAESPASMVFAALWRPTTWVFAALLFGVGFLFLMGRMFIGTIREQIDALSNSLQDFTRGRQIPTQHNPDNFLVDLVPLVTAMNQSTLQLREMLDSRGPKDIVVNPENDSSQEEVPT